MKIGSHYTGIQLKEYHTEIQWRDIMNFAAAINDDNPYYFNDLSEDGIVAHPLFISAITWPVISKLPDYIEKEQFPVGLLRNMIHYTEHIMIRKPIKPGDKLSVRGKIAAVIPHRSGAHIIIRFDAVDPEERGVFTEYIGGMIRGVDCADNGKVLEELPEIPNYDIEPAPDRYNIRINRLQSYIYDGCTNISFPIHTSEKFAGMVGLPGIILHGTATLAFAVREVVNNYCSGNPLLVRNIACRFTGMVIPGSEIVLEVKETGATNRTRHLFFDVYNSDGEKAISRGYAALGNS